MRSAKELSASTAVLALLSGVFGLHDLAVAETTVPQATDLSKGEAPMEANTKSSILKVPGATIYYEVRGAGPTLLIIPGGPQDAGVFSDLARLLADRYTVVTFDPRGNSRSPFDGPPVELSVRQHADDAAAIAADVGNGPAYLFGTSGGAQIGLDMAARYPELVHVLVAHEPPTMMLLENPEPALAADRALQEIYRTKGVDAAMAEFFDMAGLGGPDGPAEGAPDIVMSSETAATFERVSGNFEYWLAHGMIPLSTYVPDLDLLKGRQLPVIVAIGEGSAGQDIESMSLALASKLGVKPLQFPGDHMGYEAHPAGFASALHAAFNRPTP